MTTGQRNAVIAVIALAVAALIAIGILRRRHTGPGPETRPAPTRPAATGPAPATAIAPPPVPAPATARAVVVPMPAPPDRQAPAADRARAASLLERGIQLAASGKPVAARQTLADALNLGALPATQADGARKKLSQLAQLTLLSPRKFPNDPNVLWYRFKPGDVLVRVERRQKLHVPTQLLLKVNGIPDATKIQAEQTLKLIRGPFHAIVSRSRFTMDVYLEEPGTRRLVFVKRFRVGIGKDGATPAGRWRVALGRKRDRAPWTPPTSSGIERKRILWGEKGYPLGRRGYWIALEGIEGNIYTAEDAYGIHGTNDAASIGRATSMGCIRLVDDDIEQVYSMLYEHWSTVTVRK